MVKMMLRTKGHKSVRNVSMLVVLFVITQYWANFLWRLYKYFSDGFVNFEWKLKTSYGNNPEHPEQGFTSGILVFSVLLNTMSIFSTNSHHKYFNQTHQLKSTTTGQQPDRTRLSSLSRSEIWWNPTTKSLVLLKNIKTLNQKRNAGHSPRSLNIKYPSTKQIQTIKVSNTTS